MLCGAEHGSVHALIPSSPENPEEEEVQKGHVAHSRPHRTEIRVLVLVIPEPNLLTAICTNGPLR